MSRFDGARARLLRLQLGISIEELAAAAGISANTVRYAEDGKHQPRPSVVAALAAALEVSTEDLAVGKPTTLREVRHRLGLTQDQMAQRVGTVRQMVSRVERGVSGVRSPQTWAKAYELTQKQWMHAYQASRDAVRCKVAAQAHRHRRQHTGDQG